MKRTDSLRGMAENGNQLFYGDNLDILRRYVQDESVDLVYLDPPFNSNKSYNVLFKQQDGTRSEAQIEAFDDTWRWDEGAARAYHETVESGGPVSRALQAFRGLVGESDMLAYLAMMAPRLVELHRVLKPIGSMYLHCDPTASHYLKILLDAVFGAKRFKSELVWKRTSAHSDTKQGRKRHGHIHDIILFYTKSQVWTWNPVFTPYNEEYIKSSYAHKELGTGRRYQLDNLTAAKPGGDTEYLWRVKKREGGGWAPDLDGDWKNPKPGWEYNGVPPYKGRYWAYSKSNMESFVHDRRLYHAKSGMPRYKRYLDEMSGVPLQDVWTDIGPPGKAERLGYPTQKPLKLLERIIAASSNKGDVVLDPFCGCGTALASSQALGRTWIGIDVTHLAINQIKSRLRGHFGEEVDWHRPVVGEPTAVDGARQLAKDDPFQFQAWALGLADARKADSGAKGADKGIDGRLYFHDDTSGDTKQIIFSVKGGKTSVAHVRDLRGVIEREGAAIGVLLSLRNPTKPMRTEAASAGFYESPLGSSHSRIQLVTVEEMLHGASLDRPSQSYDTTFKIAPKIAKERFGQLTLPGASVAPLFDEPHS